jgi:hypothetical protein
MARANPFARLFALRALHRGLAAAFAHVADAGLAERPLAACASVRGVDVRMPGTDEGILGEHSNWSRLAGLEFGYGDRGSHALDQEFDLPQAQRLAGCEPGFFGALAVHEGAVGGIAVPNVDAIIGEHQFAVAGGDAGVLELEVILEATAEAIGAQVQFNYPISIREALNDKARHT